MKIGPFAIPTLLVAMTVAACSTQRGEIYRGFLTIDPEVEVFTPCGAETPLWLDYTKKQRKVLFERYQQLKTQPYDETYAELRGVPGPQLDCGFCEAYPGSFKVDGIVEQRARKSDDCKS